MQLLKHFKELTAHPKNAEELKGLILQLAIQGKLTKKWREENPNIESASVLLEKIAAEKAQLIKEKKIRKDKRFPEVSEDDLMYAIPTSWKWCRLQDYLDVRDGTHDTPKYVESGIPLVTSKNLYTKKLDLSKIKYISESDHIEISKRSKVDKDDILFAMIGSIGNPVIVDIEPNFSIKNVALIKYYVRELSEPHFILHFLEYATKEFKDNADGAVQSFVSLTKLRSKEFPLPPLQEQKAIVSIVNQLFKEVEELEAQTKARIQTKEDFVTSSLQQLATGDTATEWAFLQAHFKTFFTEKSAVKKLRESILQLAVQGKLTTHWRTENPNVESAASLLEKIKAEKAQLVKDKKIKKEKKALEPIELDDLPYHLPDNWGWSRMIELCQYITDGTHQTPTYTDEGRMFLSAKNVKPFKFMPDKHKYVSEEDFEGYRKNRMPEINDILLTRVGAGIGEAALIDQDIEFAIYVSVGLLKMFPGMMMPQYIVMWLNSPEGRQYSSKNTYGKGVSQGNLNLSLIRGFVVSIPPKEEQEAIVSKVNSLMALCDRLEEEIAENTEHVEQLMQSCLREVFEGEDVESDLRMAAEPEKRYQID